MKFITDLKNRVLVCSGAMGTLIQDMTDMDPFSALLRKPRIISEIHDLYLDSGADMIEALTFGANRHNLKQYGLENDVIRINKKAIELAKKRCRKANGKRYVFASIGSIGKYITPLGNLEFERAVSIYSEQIRGCLGADIIILETFSDILDMKAALVAAKYETDLPIIAEMTFDENLRTATGTDPLTALNVCQSMGATVFGANCSLSPDKMLPIVEILVKKASIPIIIQPEGRIKGLMSEWKAKGMSSDAFSRYMKRFASMGVNIVGSCCGTTPEYTRKIKEKVRGMKPIAAKKERYPMLSSRVKTVELKYPIIIGERINPTNKKGFSKDLKVGKFDHVIFEAIRQSKFSDCIDVNVSVPGTDEKNLMRSAVLSIQERVFCPLVIDSSDPVVIEEALRVCNGKCLINSVDGRNDFLEAILPLAKKYGAAIIGLCIDQDGVPSTNKGKFRIAKKIIRSALSEGIRKEDIFIDCAVSSLAVEPDAAEMLFLLDDVKRMGVNTVLGISNISHGMPDRQVFNSAFLVMAMAHHLDAVIIDPLDINTRCAFYASLSLINKEPSIYLMKRKDDPVKDEIIDDRQRFFDSIIKGNGKDAQRYAREILKEISPIEANEILIEALKHIGKEFNDKKIFLPQVLSSANAMKKAFKIIKSHLKIGSRHKGVIVFATVKDDVHDIGKNIVIAILESQGYKIIDLGHDVNAKRIVDSARKNKADLIALSALMTTTVIHMPEVIQLLNESEMNIPVIVGGAVVSKDYAKKIGARYSKDALSAVDDVKKILKKFK